jgi:autotransporter-associated beta strand protein
VNNNKIVKQGLGILVFESTNAYTGSTSVEGGMLIVTKSEGLGGSALTNSNVEVSKGTLMLSPNYYGFSQTQITVAYLLCCNFFSLLILIQLSRLNSRRERMRTSTAWPDPALHSHLLWLLPS